MPLTIKTLIEPIFKDLSSDRLLGKCLHGETQNANESFNALIWKRCPKHVFVNRTVLEIAASSAIITFNDGFQSVSRVIQEIGMLPGQFFQQGAVNKDSRRTDLCSRKSSESYIKRRKQLRAKRKGYIDKEREIEGGDSYAAGSASL